MERVRSLEAKLRSAEEAKATAMHASSSNSRRSSPPTSLLAAQSFASIDPLEDSMRWCAIVDNNVMRCEERPKTLTLVMSFPPKQLDYVVENLQRWHYYAFYPCEPKKGYASYVNLLFYVSRDDRHTLETLSSLVNSSWRHECFNHVYVKLMHESAQRSDVYGPGTLHMFYSMFDEDFFDDLQLLMDYDFSANDEHERQLRLLDSPSSRVQRSDYSLWMEPDLVPLRPLWVDKLYEDEVAHVPRFWVKGSIPRYPFSQGDWHMNGNALYATNDVEFARFVHASIGAFKPYDSFDQSLFTYFQLNPQPYAHFFVYTDTIQNRGYELYSLEEFLRNETRCFLAHGKGMLQSQASFLKGSKKRK